MVCEPTQGLFFLGREEEVYNVPQNVHSKLTMWEKLVGRSRSWQTQHHSNAVTLQAQPSSSPVVSKWLGSQQPGMCGQAGIRMPTAAGAQSRHQSHPNPTGPLCQQQFPRSSSVPWGWESTASLLELDCPSGESLGHVWTYLMGNISLEGSREQPVAVCRGGSLQSAYWDCWGLCQPLTVEQLGSCMLHLVVSGFGGAVGKARDLSSACSCCLLHVQVRQEIPGPLDGLAALGKKEQAKLCLKGRSTCLWKSCALGLSCCSLTPEFAILSFVAVLL